MAACCLAMTSLNFPPQGWNPCALQFDWKTNQIDVFKSTYSNTKWKLWRSYEEDGAKNRPPYLTKEFDSATQRLSFSGAGNVESLLMQ